MELASRKLEAAVEQLASLPGIGRKTALRLALHLLRRPEADVRLFSESIRQMKAEVMFCQECHHITDEEICDICSDSSRDRSSLCVVEDMRDVLAIESTGQYKGLYHVLGGHISPMDGIGPSDLHIDSLIQRAETGEVKEIILALSTTMEGDTTNFFIYRKLGHLDLSLSTLARGLAIGDELEYTDEVTLGRSIVNRQPYESSLKS